MSETITVVPGTPIEVKEWNGKKFTNFSALMNGEIVKGNCFNDQSKMLKEAQDKGTQLTCTATFNEQFKNYRMNFPQPKNSTWVSGKTPFIPSGNFYKGKIIGEEEYFAFQTRAFENAFRTIYTIVAKARKAEESFTTVMSDPQVAASIVEAAKVMSNQAMMSLRDNVVTLGKPQPQGGQCDGVSTPSNDDSHPGSPESLLQTADDVENRIALLLESEVKVSGEETDNINLAIKNLDAPRERKNELYQKLFSLIKK